MVDIPVQVLFLFLFPAQYAPFLCIHCPGPFCFFFPRRPEVLPYLSQHREGEEAKMKHLPRKLLNVLNKTWVFLQMFRSSVLIQSLQKEVKQMVAVQDTHDRIHL